MAWLLAAPVLVKVLATLALMLALNRAFRQLPLSLAIGSVVLAVWTGHTPASAAAIAWRRTYSFSNLCLITVVFQVIWLSTQMAAAGVMKDLVETVRARMSRRATMGILPAVIGLLPMPGGALFSAPLVGDVDHDRTVEPVLKTQINYWFRHVWEYWWPLYPGVLLALELTGLEVWQLVLVQLPFCVVALGAGYVFLLRKIEKSEEGAGSLHAFLSPRFVQLIAPILVVILTYACIRLGSPSLAKRFKYLPMMVGIVIAMLAQQAFRPLKARQWREILLSRKVLTMAVLVALVRVYGAFIEAPLPSGVLLVEQMRRELAALGIPLIAITMLLPFVSGLATGLTVGHVGASFPIIFSLLGPDPPLLTQLATLVLAFGVGHMGMMLSPVHVCLIVSNEHFASRLSQSLGGLVKPAIVMLITALVWHMVLRAMGG